MTTADIEVAMAAAGGDSRRQRNAQQAGMRSHNERCSVTRIEQFQTLRVKCDVMPVANSP